MQIQEPGRRSLRQQMGAPRSQSEEVSEMRARDEKTKVTIMEKKAPEPLIAEMANVPLLQQAKIASLTERVRAVRVILLEYIQLRENHGHAPNAGGEKSGTL